MNEQLDAIVSEYEDVWRQAALKGRQQFCRNEWTNQPLGHCAVTIGTGDQIEQLSNVLRLADADAWWNCPYCRG
jgi:hypothetical protein